MHVSCPVLSEFWVAGTRCAVFNPDMNLFRLFRRAPKIAETVPAPVVSEPEEARVRRYFHNLERFQCYTTWFSFWGGWISAGHCVSDAQGHVAAFARGKVMSWPDGLDAALVGCALPAARPTAPRVGQDVVLQGYPAGSAHLASRTAKVYLQRSPGQWITHITQPIEPVVTGMSGGPVLDAVTREPIGIIITRNSPADLNNDRIPDESADFIALSDVWDAVRKAPTTQAVGNV